MKNNNKQSRENNFEFNNLIILNGEIISSKHIFKLDLKNFDVNSLNKNLSNIGLFHLSSLYFILSLNICADSCGDLIISCFPVNFYKLV